MTRLRVGITPWGANDSEAGTRNSGFLAQAELVERLGFHSFWLPESHFRMRASFPAPLLLLAAAAARTQRLRLGTTSYLLPVRHPVQVAEEVAVLEQLSGGRVILGVGRGFRRDLFEVFDVPARKKRERFESALEVMRRVWQGGPVHDGSQTRVMPQPLQRPHPPIWVAAFGPKALKQAGRLDLPYLASPLEPIERLAENYALHAQARPLPHAPSLSVPIIRTLFLTRDPQRAESVREALRAELRPFSRGTLSALHPTAHSDINERVLVGDPETVRDQIAEYRKRLGLTHLIVRAAVAGARTQEIEHSLRLLAELAEEL